jgi:hypothetical protein
MTTTSRNGLVACLLVLAAAVGCKSSAPSSDDGVAPSPTAGSGGASSDGSSAPGPVVGSGASAGAGTGGSGVTAAPTGNGASVVWKRARAVERDLMRGLGLEAQEVCTELGAISCVNDAHLSLLGGNEPFVKVQYTQIAEPGAVTPLVMDRVVLSACTAAVERDSKGSPKVFKHFSLSEPARPKDEPFLRALDQQHAELFRLLLGRDGSEQELAPLRQLATNDAGEPLSGKDLSVLGCFVVGTHLEFVFL